MLPRTQGRLRIACQIGTALLSVEDKNFQDITIFIQNQERGRLFSNYYRVAFFGKLWRDLQGKEFVYRANDTVRLNDFTTRLKVLLYSSRSKIMRVLTQWCLQAQFSKKFGNKVELLGNISVDLSKLKDDVCYFQVVSLSEYFEPAEIAVRPNLWDKKFNLSTHLFLCATWQERHLSTVNRLLYIRKSIHQERQGSWRFG